MPRTICKYCKLPVFKRDRCKSHYEGYIAKRNASHAQPSCKTCPNKLRLGNTTGLCLSCETRQAEALQKARRDAQLDQLLFERFGAP